MALLPILTIPDPRLRVISTPVERIDAEIHRLLDDMLETMYEAPGIGLAAVQVGVAKRIVVIDIAKRKDDAEPPAPIFLLNPEIIWACEELSTYNEGCLSVPEYFEDVQRPARVRARGHHVLRAASFEHADRQRRGVQRVDPSAQLGVQRDHDLGDRQDRVAPMVRIGAV